MNLHPNHSRWPSALTLCVALVVCCFQVRPSVAQTQPSPPLPPQFVLPTLAEIPAAEIRVPLSAEQKAAVDKALAFWDQARICKTPIDLKMTDATLDDVVARIKQEPKANGISIEVRDAIPTRLSFDLKQTKIGNILDIVAGLAGCKLYLLPSGLLIAPESKLFPVELQDIQDSRERKGGQWIKSSDSGLGGWNTWQPVGKVLFQAVAADITGKPVEQLPSGIINTTFDHFSPQSQQLLLVCADSFNENRRLSSPDAAEVHLKDASPVMVKIYAPDRLGVSFLPDSPATGAPPTLALPANLP